MNVKELIELLQTLPQNKEVLCEGYSTSFTPKTIGEVEYTNKYSPGPIPSKVVICEE